MKNTSYSLVRAALTGKRRRITIGHSSHSAGVGTGTPISIIAGDAPPQLLGNPYLKTGFNNGRGFSMTLYTPSTLRVIVGAEWLANQQGVWSATP